MKTLLDIDGQKAGISFDQDISLLRGEFPGPSDGADFYASDVAGLIEEGRQSLKVYLDMCAENNVERYRRLSGI
jgi:predicted HicB family RNase H-like nuclease